LTPIDEIKYKLTGHMKFIETPNFLLTKEQYKLYRNKTDKYLFTWFLYVGSKKELDIISKLKSKDKFNREKNKKEQKFLNYQI
jgi:hypothetical protein